jgi:hypothetical protein
MLTLLDTKQQQRQYWKTNGKYRNSTGTPNPTPKGI